MGACGSKNVEADTPREVAQVGTQAKPAPVHEEAADTNQITIKITEPEKKCDPQIAAYLSHVPLLSNTQNTSECDIVNVPRFGPFSEKPIYSADELTHHIRVHSSQISSWPAKKRPWVLI